MMSRWSVGAVVMLLMSSAACAAESGGAEGDLQIHQINALTGQSAVYGEQAVNGAIVAAKQINDAGGFEDDCGESHKIALTSFDMANAGGQAIAGLRRAASDKDVVAVIGPTPSTGFVPMLPVVEDLKIPMISAGSGALVDKWNPYAYRVTVSNEIGEPAQMRILESEFGVDDVAVLYDITQDSERSGAEIVRDAADDVGYNMVAFESFRGGDSDFASQITKIKAQSPKYVGVYAAAPEMSKIINQMKQLGLLADVNVFGHAGILNDPDVWKLTDGAVKDAFTWTVAVDLESDDAEISAFVSAFKKQKDMDPTIFAVYGAQALRALVDAATRSCTVTDRTKFAKALGQTDISVLGSQVQFDSTPSRPNGENLGADKAVQETKVTGPGTFDVVGAK